MLLLTWLIHMAMAEPDNSEDLRQAEELFLNGQQLYNEQRYNAAIIAWKEGYEMTKLPAFLKNIALAQEAMNEYSEALETLSTYRAFAPHEEQDALREWQENLETQLEEQVALREWHESLIAEKAILEAQLKEISNDDTSANTQSNGTEVLDGETPETKRNSFWT